jgi:NAD(P)-dependent dehydrogenase (short-subunit alcohol dehydrogenase family)
MAQDLAARDIVVTIINPGVVDTKGVLDLKPGDPVPDVFKPLIPLIESGELQLMRPAESAAAMAGVIDELTAEDAGRFINFDGSELAW